MIMNQGVSGAAIPLPLAGRGRAWRVSGVVGEESLRRRLSEMGFVSGTPVEVLQSDNRGMMVIRLGASRLALTGGMAGQVRVQ